MVLFIYFPLYPLTGKGVFAALRHVAVLNLTSAGKTENWTNLPYTRQKGGNFRLRTLTPVQGKGLKKARGENPNAIYEVPQVMEPVVNKEAKLHEVKLKKLIFMI